MSCNQPSSPPSSSGFNGSLAFATGMPLSWQRLLEFLAEAATGLLGLRWGAHTRVGGAPVFG